MRRDYKGVAEVINHEAKESDLVISAHQAVDYYTDKLDYILCASDNFQFENYTACRGKKERWTNLDLIYDVQHLFDLAEKSNLTTWIIINKKSTHSDEIQVFERYKDHLYFNAQDGILGILKLQKAS